MYVYDYSQHFTLGWLLKQLSPNCEVHISGSGEINANPTMSFDFDIPKFEMERCSHCKVSELIKMGVSNGVRADDAEVIDMTWEDDESGNKYLEVNVRMISTSWDP